LRVETLSTTRWTSRSSGTELMMRFKNAELDGAM
jgi:hypothetical protein